MQVEPTLAARQELFSAEEIARAAGVEHADVRAILAAGRVVAFRGFVASSDAVALVRRLVRGAEIGRAPLATVAEPRRRSGPSLAASALLHMAFALLLGSAGLLGWLTPTETEESVPQEVHLVYLMSPGPGGGGGGGGLQMQLEPPPAKRQAPSPVVKKISSPVVPVHRPPPVRSTARLMRPIEPPRMEPKPIDRPLPPLPPAPQVVQAPVRAVPADAVDAPGLVASRSKADSQGPGTDGGVGSGAGSGTGQGEASGIGPGTGGGTGGGPYRPGSGIEPPRVVNEVRPTYTDEARRRGIEGDVSLEVVVTRDGRVGSVRMLRGLGAGLDQKAMEAVRQWRFSPARRQGVPVDVVVQVSVEFKLR